MNFNLSFSIFTLTAMDASSIDTVDTLETLKRTSTEFISEISAPTVSTSFDFHLFDFLVKGRQMCIVCVCALLSRSLVTPRHRCVMMHEIQ